MNDDEETVRTFSQESEPSLVEYTLVILGLAADMVYALLRECGELGANILKFLAVWLVPSSEDPYDDDPLASL